MDIVFRFDNSTHFFAGYAAGYDNQPFDWEGRQSYLRGLAQQNVPLADVIREFDVGWCIGMRDGNHISSYQEVQRVAKGHTRLDQIRPNWYTEGLIDLERFSIQDWFNCLLGQLFGNYWDGVIDLDLIKPTTATYDHGFFGKSEQDKQHLQSLWSAIIRQRRMEATLLALEGP